MAEAGGTALFPQDRAVAIVTWTYLNKNKQGGSEGKGGAPGSGGELLPPSIMEMFACIHYTASGSTITALFDYQSHS